jgi:hypothetical protein
MDALRKLVHPGKHSTEHVDPTVLDFEQPDDRERSSNILTSGLQKRVVQEKFCEDTLCTAKYAKEVSSELSNA